MATTKLWKVENRLDNVVNYASDKSKTEIKKYGERIKNSVHITVNAKISRYDIFCGQLVNNWVIYVNK